MQALKKIPFFLFLLVLFFCLHGSVENYGHLNAREVFVIGGYILLSMAVLLVISWLVTRNLLFASLLTFFVGIWYLFFGAIHDFLKATTYLHFLKSYSVLLPGLLIVNLLVLWWLVRNKVLFNKLFVYLNFLFLIFCIVDIGLLAAVHISYKNKKEAFAEMLKFDQAKVSTKPNVYFLLFDEYAGYQSLQDSFKFKNDSLYNFLQQQRFKLLPIFSNYDFTPYSMSSILNMQYVPENYDKKLLTQLDIQHRFGEIRNSQVPAVFKSMGYMIENYSIFDFKDYPALYDANGLFPIHTALLTNKLFHKRVIKDIGWWFVTGKLQIPYVKQHIMYRDDVYNTSVKEKLISTSVVQSQVPKFCYAHFFLPHGPYFRDSTGALNTPEKIPDLYNKPIYLSYLKYTNKVIMELVKHISYNDPTAIIIIMSDHGFYDYDVADGYHPFNFNNICLVKSPATDTATVDLPKSNVNFFRYLFNTDFGQKFPYLNDSTVFVLEENAFK